MLLSKAIDLTARIQVREALFKPKPSYIKENLVYQFFFHFQFIIPKLY
ncbi:hypothetical protein SLEP1_g7722 [Rubroshorea leprosula]|uniref:Ribosomal protein L32 n=1 Tax=Rubroshorea leprosula TaxID=152421 RepID=A0AAV5I3X0_9ROSI|nr:hypothetical protein SLEP1_g7722 [Rubroshorea leprosula]